MSITPSIDGFDGHVGRFVAIKEESYEVQLGVVACNINGMSQIQLGWHFTSYECCNRQKKQSRRYTQSIHLETWERDGLLIFIDSNSPGYNPLSNINNVVGGEEKVATEVVEEDGPLDMVLVGAPDTVVEHVLVLCSGSGHDAKSYKRLYPSAEVDTLDIRGRKTHQPTIMEDILQWDFKQVPMGKYQVVHASPPCTPFSRANPSSSKASEKLGVDIAKRCFEIINHLAPMVWIFENPANRLVDQPYMEQMEEFRHLTNYCHFGTLYAKPTNIWTNVTIDLPKCTRLTPCPHVADSGRHPRTSQQGSSSRADGTVVMGTPPEIAQQMPIELLRSILTASFLESPVLSGVREESVDETFACEICKHTDDEALMLLCDGCGLGFHMRCANVKDGRVPPGDWYCSSCEK